MTNETQQPTHTPEQKTVPFGSRLKSAREALGLDRKDAAAQLRLTEKIITMMEKDRYPADLPPTFIRGYIRAYGKLLQIPEYEIKKAIEPIQPKPQPTEAIPVTKAQLPLPVTSSNYFMQIFTYLIILTMIGLVAVWWYTKKPSAAPSEIEGLANIEANANTSLAPATETAAPQAAAPNNPVTNNAAAPAVRTGQPAASTTQPAAAQPAQAPIAATGAQLQKTPAGAAKPSRNENRANADSAVDSEEEADQNAESSNNNAENTETYSDNAD